MIDNALYQQAQNAFAGRQEWFQRFSSLDEISLPWFIEHATRTVPFYSAFQRCAVQQSSLDSFPVLSRNDLTTSPSRFYSDQFPSDHCNWATTSGTTGQPLSIPRDSGSLYGFVLDTHRMVYKRFQYLKAIIKRSDVAVVLVNDNPDRESGFQILPALGFKLLRKIVIGKNDESDRLVLRDIRQHAVPILWGRPRALSLLAELDQSIGGGRIRPNLIITSGDNLHDDVRANIKMAFGAPVHNAYASREGGIVALECTHQCGLHVFAERVHVEIMNEVGAISNVGTGELVITNKENWALPLIRYRTGDGGTLTNQTCQCGYVGPTITHLSGRDSLFFFLNEQRLNPSRLNPVFESMPVKQFQVIQETQSNLRVRVVLDNSSTPPSQIIRLLESELRCVVGEAISIRIEICEQLAEAGKKVQRFVCRIE